MLVVTACNCFLEQQHCLSRGRASNQCSRPVTTPMLSITGDCMASGTSSSGCSVKTSWRRESEMLQTKWMHMPRRASACLDTESGVGGDRIVNIGLLLMHHVVQLVARHVPLGAEDRAGGADRDVGVQIDQAHALGCEVLVGLTPHNVHGVVLLLRADLVHGRVEDLQQTPRCEAPPRAFEHATCGGKRHSTLPPHRRRRQHAADHSCDAKASCCLHACMLG